MLEFQGDFTVSDNFVPETMEVVFNQCMDFRKDGP